MNKDTLLSPRAFSKDSSIEAIAKKKNNNKINTKTKLIDKT